jgi:glutaryl-CoA dehydrogenase (non-decarboxylating)
MLDFELDETHKAIQQEARRFAQQKISPTVDEDDRLQRFPIELVREMGQLGLFGSAFPADVGGSGAGYLAHSIIVEEISKVCSSLRALFNTQGMTCPMTILRWGNQKQIDRYVRGLVKAELIGLFGLTEPDAGSDVVSMKMKAIKKGDRYILNGTKTFITNATVFDVGVVFAKTDPDKSHRGISAFIVHSDMEGLSCREIKPKLGHHSSPTGEMVFEDGEVPHENLLGPEGEGFRIAMEALDRGRLSVAAGAVGLAQACIEESIRYSRERVQFGQPIGRFQMIQERIAQMVVETEASRLLVWRLASMLDRGKPCTLQGSIAKYMASETAVRAANFAVEIYGAYGYSEDYKVARLYRDAKMYQIGEGTSNIQRMIIASDALGYRSANRYPASEPTF